MRIGYARTSTEEQKAGYEAQVRDLRAAPGNCERVFGERVSSVGDRKALDTAIDYLRDNDVLVVTKLDRLARSMRNLLDIVERIQARGAGLVILNMNMDTTTPTGKLMLQVLGAVAEFERSMMLERQREGITKAKAEKRFLGRRPEAFAQADKIREFKASGKGPSEIAAELGLHRASVYRVLNADPEREKALKAKLGKWKAKDDRSA